MATTKTLTPTNQAITLAAFTEKPDNRTNVTNDDRLADAVNTLNSKSTNSITKVVSGGTMDCHSLYKVGNTVFASIRIHSLDNVATDQVFCTIPSGFRPKQNTYVNAFASITHNGTTRVGQAVFLMISPNGDVSGSYSASATLSQLFFSASWSIE